MNHDRLTHLCGTLDAPMIVITTFDGRERSGVLAGFHTQCSIHPQRWLVCISHENHTAGVAARAQRLAVHFLRADQHALADLFGGETADAIGPEQKFARCAWREGTGGVPILDGCDWIAGPILDRRDVGDHTAYVIAVEELGEEHAPAPQLGSHAVRDIRPGHPA